MRLVDNSVGVTDIISYRDCAKRAAFGMRRHTAAGEHPQATSPSNAYGSGFHEAVGFIAATGADDDGAVHHVLSGPYGRWFSPDDIGRLRDDLATYRQRDYVDVETIAFEQEMRVPLMHYNGEQYFYRFRVDRLYRSIADPGTFIHVDYKTSAHPKTRDEIHSDVQMSAYAFGLREMYPEIVRLVQVYDQLNFGAVPTTRTPRQLALVKEWLIDNAITMIDDEEPQPTYNSFCAFCPILTDCEVIPQLTDFALAEMAGLIPNEVNGELIGADGEVLTADALKPYAEALERVGKARRILEAFDGRVRGALRQMPVERRLEMGFQMTVPNVSTWPPEALRAIADILGPEFWNLIELRKAAVARLPKDTQEVLNAMTTTHHGAPRLTAVKRKEADSDETN